MKAAVIDEKNRVSIKKVEDPILAPDEILVKVKYCGICASDINPYYSNKYNPGMTRSI